MRPLLLVLLTLFPFANCFTQDTKTTSKDQGTIYFNWGWNRSGYTRSNIHFAGAYYDFTLKDVKATDRPSPFGLDPYFHPLKLTIPQVNYGMGYFLKEQKSIYLGVDHMKYVVTQSQKVKIDGQINGTPYDGTYNDTEIEITDRLLLLEHTDGLNYIHFGYAHHGKKYYLNPSIFGSLMGGGAAGLIYPRTNATILGNERYDEFNLAGYGITGKIALRISFWNKFFIQATTKAGFINMPNIRTTQFVDDKASQHFFFLQSNLLFGGLIKLNKP